MKLHLTSANKKLLTSALALFLCVALTGIALFDRIGGFLLDDSGAILLIPELVETEQIVHENEGILGNAKVNAKGIVNDTVEKGPPIEGYEIVDDDTVWDTNTQIHIFKISYENGQQTVTVNSNDGDKLLAPGTENSYTFKLKNNSGRAVDYVVTVEAFFTPENIAIPVQGRINRYDGEWIVGDQDTWVDVLGLDGVEDEDTLGAGKYTYYTLDWKWPFESGNDAYDTLLGNTAVDQDLELTIVINTLATASMDKNSQNGITPPKTGDVHPTSILISIGGAAFAVMILLYVDERREKTCRRK